MECPRCHSQNAPGASECTRCGASLLSGAMPAAGVPDSTSAVPGHRETPPPAGAPLKIHPRGSDYPGETEAIPASMSDLTIGSTFVGRYRITQELGRGGMGVVYKAEDVRLKRAVALKFLPWWLTCEDTAKERFVHEAQAASALDHTNICTIYEVDETHDGQMFMAMAFCEGEPLKKRIERGPLAPEDAIDIAIQTCDGLATAHEVGMIHRDIKPANIMVNERGHVKVVDFGLAKLTGQTRLTRAGTVVGTVAYMSPEQARGDDVDPRTDIWSMGVVLYEMLTGRLPFKGDNDQAIIHSILNEEPEMPGRHDRKIPAALERAVLRCLRKNPEERYASADDLQAELVSIRGEHPATSVSGRILQRARVVSPRRRARRRRVISICAALAVCVLASLCLLPRGRPLIDLVKVSQILGLRGLPAGRFVAVLPLAVASSDPEIKALADGLVDTHTRKMVVIDGFADSLWVVPPADILSGKTGTPAQVRDRLGVNLAFTGSMSVAGDLVSLAIQLVDTYTGVRLKTKTLSEPLANLATWQDSVAVVMARMVGVSLKPTQRARLRTGCTAVPSAFRHFLLGRGFLNPQGVQENVDAAVASLKKAIEADSCFALAHTALGDAYRTKLRATKDTVWASLGIACCERAIELNDSLALPHLVLGLIELNVHRPEQAIGDFEAAIAADSSYAETYGSLASAYRQIGRNDLAEAAFKRLIALRPRSQNTYNSLGQLYLSEGEYEKAIRPFQAMIKVAPGRAGGYNNLGATYYNLERLSEAEEMFKRSIEIEPQYSAYSNLGSINYYNARYADAAAMYKEAIDIKDDDYNIWGHYAEACYWTPGAREKGVAIYQTAASLAEKKLGRGEDSVTVLADLASYCAMIGDRAKSAAYLQRALAAGPKDINAMFRISETYESQGDREKALEWLGRALEGGCAPMRIERAPGLTALRSDRRFEILRSHY